MDLSCSRCNQTVQEGNCYCPNCGLPQFVFSAENSGEAGQGERWGEAVRDANTVDWNSALRSTLPLAIPAGVLCSLLSPVSVFLIAAAAAWAVVLYMRTQRPSWITVGAGARIGFVTGIVGSWTAAAMSGISLYAMRFWLNQGGAFDDRWQELVNHRLQQKWEAMGVDAQTISYYKTNLLSTDGRAGWILFFIAFLMVALVLFAIGGGALGARMLNRTRRPEN